MVRTIWTWAAMLVAVLLQIAIVAPRPLTLSQYDQVGAEVNGTLDVAMLQRWMTETNANTHSFLLWDTDGHQYLDSENDASMCTLNRLCRRPHESNLYPVCTAIVVRFLSESADFKVNGEPFKVWVTLIPPSETTPAVPPTPPNFTDWCASSSSHECLSACSA